MFANNTEKDTNLSNRAIVTLKAPRLVKRFAYLNATVSVATFAAYPAQLTEIGAASAANDVFLLFLTANSIASIFLPRARLANTLAVWICRYNVARPATGLRRQQ
jgi:hypothetical protein